MENYLVVGAATGIGEATTRQLLEKGHQVYATYHEHPMPFTHANLEVEQLDVLNETLDLDFLPEQVDGVVYCPGSINLRPFHRIKPADFLSDVNLQVGGAIKTLQGVLPRLQQSSKASVVLFSTVAVRIGYPFHAQVAASKGAVEGLTRSLAAEWAPRIRVNAIAPSLTDTPLAGRLLNNEKKREDNAQRHPLKRVGEATDLANMATFLLGDQSTWITGQVMAVDGGMSGVKA